MKILHFLLLPFVPLYSLAIRIWAWLYKAGIWGKARFSVPVIAVGNIQTGGTGKTPHVAFIADFLSKKLRVGIMSRGYKRMTYGYRMSAATDGCREIGDEPTLLRRLIPDAVVAVAENRVEGIPHMLADRPDVGVVVLDDAFQQLGIRIDLNILLTPYHRPFSKDYLLPFGRLREPTKVMSRADVLIVSNCPKEKLENKRVVLRELNLNPLPHQKVFLTAIRYATPYHLFYEGDFRTLKKGEKALLVTGIADAIPLLQHLQEKEVEVFHLSYRDHHKFTVADIRNIAKNKQQIFGDAPALILTTEKDAMRLIPLKEAIQQEGLEFYVQPVSLIWDQSGSEFLEILDQLTNKNTSLYEDEE